MSARRIRCECGRVYEPAKHEKCPGCGAESSVATLERPKQSEDDEAFVRRSADDDVQSEDAKPLAISGRSISIAAAVVLVGIIAVVALVRRHEPATQTKTNDATPRPTQTATATPQPTATATVQPTATAVASA